MKTLGWRVAVMVSLVVLATSFLVSPSIAQTEIDLPTGVRMHVVEQGPAAGPALVLLHGYTDSGFSFSRVAPALSTNRRVIVPDLRGHGRSSRPATGYTMDDLAADVMALLDALGVETAVVVGHSMGSLVAQRIAASFPGRVEALVLVGSAPSIHALPGLDEFRVAVDGLTDPVPEEFARSFQESTVALPLPDGFMDGVVAESLRLPARVWQQLLAGMLATEPVRAGDVSVPTLLQWGAEDGVFSRDQQDELLALFPDARLIVYDGVGHAPHWEIPKPFVVDLETFLDGLSTPDA